MGDNNGVPASFNLNPKGAGTLKLQSVVQERLLSFMEADYTDKVLAEYIVVLVAHGKTQSQAAGELEAFLGPERSNSFTKWLWDHVSANLSIYSDASELDPDAGPEGSPRQSDASTESEASEGPESGDEEQLGTSVKRADESKREEEERYHERLHDRRAPLDDRNDRRGAFSHQNEGDGRSGHHRHEREKEERDSIRRSEERRRSSPPERLEREERRAHHRRRSKEDWHRERKGRGFADDERLERDSRHGEKEHYGRDHPPPPPPPPPPPRGEPFLEERREDWGSGRRGEQRSMGEERAREQRQNSGRMEGGQKRPWHVMRADLDAPAHLSDPPPPPRSRPRLAGIPDYARIMGIALKAVAEAADEAAQAAKGGPAAPPAPAPATRVAGDNIWRRLGAGAKARSGGEEEMEEEPPVANQKLEQPGRDAERRRMNAKLRERLTKTADVTRKVVRAGPAGPSVTVTFGGRGRASHEPGLHRRQSEAQEQPPQEVAWKEGAGYRSRDRRVERERTSWGKGRAIEVEQEVEEVAPEEEQPEEVEWQEAEEVEEPEGAAFEEVMEAVEEEPEVSVDADVAEMKRRMRSVQLEMIKLRAKQREGERTQGAPPPGPLPVVKPPTPQELDARTIVVSNVHFAATKEVLAAHFSQAGAVTDVRILLDPATGRPRGCAFVTFDSEEAKEQALRLDGTSILSRQLKVAPKSSALAILKSLPTFVPRPLPVSLAARGPRPPLRRGVVGRGSTKWVRPGATMLPPAKSPKSQLIPQNLTWRRPASTGTPPAVVSPSQPANGAACDADEDDGGAREA